MIRQDNMSSDSHLEIDRLDEIEKYVENSLASFKTPILNEKDLSFLLGAARRGIQPEQLVFQCVHQLVLHALDSNNQPIEGQSFTVEEGSVWKKVVPPVHNTILIRLINEKGSWLDILEEQLQYHFKQVKE